MNQGNGSSCEHRAEARHECAACEFQPWQVQRPVPPSPWSRRGASRCWGACHHLLPAFPSVPKPISARRKSVLLLCGVGQGVGCTYTCCHAFNITLKTVYTFVGFLVVTKLSVDVINKFVHAGRTLQWGFKFKIYFVANLLFLFHARVHACQQSLPYVLITTFKAAETFVFS